MRHFVGLSSGSSPNAGFGSATFSGSHQSSTDPLSPPEARSLPVCPENMFWGWYKSISALYQQDGILQPVGDHRTQLTVVMEGSLILPMWCTAGSPVLSRYTCHSCGVGGAGTRCNGCYVWVQSRTTMSQPHLDFFITTCRCQHSAPVEINGEYGCLIAVPHNLQRFGSHRDVLAMPVAFLHVIVLALYRLIGWGHTKGCTRAIYVDLHTPFDQIVRWQVAAAGARALLSTSASYTFQVIFPPWFYTKPQKQQTPLTA